MADGNEKEKQIEGLSSRIVDLEHELKKVKHEAGILWGFIGDEQVGYEKFIEWCEWQSDDTDEREDGPYAQMSYQADDRKKAADGKKKD